MTVVNDEVQQAVPTAPEFTPATSTNSFWSAVQKVWATLVNWVLATFAVVTIPLLLISFFIPLFTGAVNLNVLTGSMSPNINVGDKVFSKPVDVNTLKVGDVITYLPSDKRTGGVPIVHRVKDFVRDDAKVIAIITKGDANPVQDDPVLPEQVTGKIISVIPYGGYPYMWLHNQKMPTAPAEW